MSDWQELLSKPDPADDDSIDEWFTTLATRLLCESELFVGGEALQFTEVEFYYHAPEHPDPFTHRDPIQLECGRWYFHRTGGVYRSGSFKGFDLSFGDNVAFAGILIRGLRRRNDELIDGPSLCVDHLLDATAAEKVAALDKAIKGRQAWAAGNPMLLRLRDEPGDEMVYRSARVGLSLKRALKLMPEYVMRRYRFFTEPRRISKGKTQMVLDFHIQGMTPEEIQKLTGCTRRSITSYIEAHEEGKEEADFTPFEGADLSAKDLSKLHGVWQAVYGEE
jgi:hypothetical protein